MKEELRKELKFSPERTIPSNHADPLATVQSLLAFLAYFAPTLSDRGRALSLGPDHRSLQMPGREPPGT